MLEPKSSASSQAKKIMTRFAFIVLGISSLVLVALALLSSRCYLLNQSLLNPRALEDYFAPVDLSKKEQVKSLIDTFRWCQSSPLSLFAKPSESCPALEKLKKLDVLLNLKESASPDRVRELNIDPEKTLLSIEQAWRTIRLDDDSYLAPFKQSLATLAEGEDASNDLRSTCASTLGVLVGRSERFSREVGLDLVARSDSELEWPHYTQGILRNFPLIQGISSNLTNELQLKLELGASRIDPELFLSKLDIFRPLFDESYAEFVSCKQAIEQLGREQEVQKREFSKSLNEAIQARIEDLSSASSAESESCFQYRFQT